MPKLLILALMLTCYVVLAQQEHAVDVALRFTNKVDAQHCRFFDAEGTRLSTEHFNGYTRMDVPTSKAPLQLVIVCKRDTMRLLLPDGLPLVAEYFKFRSGVYDLSKGLVEQTQSGLAEVLVNKVSSREDLWLACRKDR